MAGRLRIGGTIQVYSEDPAATGETVASVVGINVGEVTYTTSEEQSAEGATQIFRTRLNPIIVTFRTREIDMDLVKLKWRSGIDIIYRANLHELTTVGTVPLTRATHEREVLNCRGTFTSVNTPDTDFGTVPVTTVTMSCTQYLRGTISYDITNGVITGGATVNVGEFANLDHGLHIVGGAVTTADADKALTADQYTTGRVSAPTPPSDGVYAGGEVIGDYDTTTTLVAPATPAPGGGNTGGGG